MVMARFSASNTIDCVQRGPAVAQQPAERRDTPPAPPSAWKAIPSANTCPRAAPGWPAANPSTDCRSRASRARHAGRGPRSGDQVPRSSRCATMAPPANSTSAASAISRAGRAQRNGGERHHHADRHHADRRGRRRPGCPPPATPRPRWPAAGCWQISILVGSLATRPSGVTLPIASPARKARSAGAERQPHLGPHAQPPRLRPQAEPQRRRSPG